MGWWDRNVYQVDLDVAGNLSGRPESTIWSTWVGGVMAPLGMAGYGVYCCLVHQALIPGDAYSSLVLHGRAGVALGLAWLSGGVFLHFHYYWPTVARFCPFANLGKGISLLGFIAALGYVWWATAVVGWGP